MEFARTAEQEQLDEGVRRYLARAYSFAVRARKLSAGRDFDAGVWEHFAELGWLAAAVPESSGGIGGPGEIAVLMEAFGGALVTEPFEAIAVGGARARLGWLWAREESRDLKEFAAGRLRPVLAHLEPADGDPAQVTRAIAAGRAGWRLVGRKSPVPGAPHATEYLVTARLRDDDLAVFRIPAGTPGVARRDFAMLDGRAAGELCLDVEIEEAPLWQGDAAHAVVRDALEHQAVASAAGALGSLLRALEMTRDYVKSRRQFGTPIGSFQALRHRIADQQIEAELARSMVALGTRALAMPPGSERSAIIVAMQSRVSQAALAATSAAIHLHGAIGMTEEYEVGHHYRRALVEDLMHAGAASAALRYAALAGGCALP